MPAVPPSSLGTALSAIPLAAILAVIPGAATAVPAAPGPPPTGSPVTSGAASPTGGRCRAVVSVTLRWAGGYEGVMTLSNAGADPMHAWYVAWELPPGSRLDEVWNGIAMVSGPTAMIHAPSWHSPLLPGDTASAGFLASGDPPAEPPAVQCG